MAEEIIEKAAEEIINAVEEGMGTFVNRGDEGFIADKEKQ